MLETHKISDKRHTNKIALGSLLIGIISIIGIVLVGYGAILSVAGILLGVLSLKETKQMRQREIIIIVVGFILNSLGIVSIFF
ncbi:hypothetical protein [Paenibacillus xylanilyticus]|uniref:hypothetical protein n=1 Tax=Paenibacillus xylanilyticus TaxID=248903 RepID=UPI0039A308EC